jgi:tetratricopeptide (TPR) repeat protein
MTIAEALVQAREYHELGQLQQAEQLFQAVLQADPRHVEALYGAGRIASRLGRLDDAVARLRAVLRVQADFAEAHLDLGVALHLSGKLAEAAECYREAIRLKPELPMAHNNLATVLQASGDARGAEMCYREALRLAPDYAGAHNNLASVLHKLGQSAEAEAHCRSAIRLAPDFAEAYDNLGCVLHDGGRLAEAEACCREAIRVKPAYSGAYSTLGSILFVLGRLEEASSFFDEALRRRPDYADAHLHRGIVLLLSGDYERGWPEYEWRQRSTKFQHAPLSAQPIWDGKNWPGATVLVRAEQGLGDTLQFIRYARLVKERVGRVIVEGPAGLTKILGTCSGVDEVVARGQPLPAFDAHIYMMSLPGVLGTTLANIPAQIPYLSADRALVEHWRGELSRHEGIKVGIVWQGSLQTFPGRCRAIPLACFARLARIEGVQLFSLQKGAGAEQLYTADAPDGIVDLGPRLDESAGPFMDTAAVLMNLDLLITSDTAVGHLAGALGVPVWIALPLVPHWPWLLQREDSPWYPSVRLFRQHEFGKWHDVFERIASELKCGSRRVARNNLSE